MCGEVWSVEKDELRRRLNREFAKLRRDNQPGGRKRQFSPKKYKLEADESTKEAKP